jgi:hypothetical protein
MRSSASARRWGPPTNTGAASKPVRLIVFAWLNDEDTLRKAGSKTDVYAAFQRMLARGEVPGEIEALLKESRGG